MVTLQHFLGFLNIVTLAGCATLSQEECVRGDWFGLGVTDGRAGEIKTRLDAHQKACMEYGIAVNNEDYFAGREQGLIDYCQLDNAFRTGLSGQQYYHVCPPSLDGLFTHYHSAAFAVHENHTELERLDNELANKENYLHDKRLTDKERTKLRNEIMDLDRKRYRLRDDLYYNERQLDNLRRETNSSQ